jgi:hypothetical protein
MSGSDKRRPFFDRPFAVSCVITMVVEAVIALIGLTEPFGYIVRRFAPWTYLVPSVLGLLIPLSMTKFRNRPVGDQIVGGFVLGLGLSLLCGVVVAFIAVSSCSSACFGG